MSPDQLVDRGAQSIAANPRGRHRLLRVDDCQKLDAKVLRTLFYDAPSSTRLLRFGPLGSPGLLVFCVRWPDGTPGALALFDGLQADPADWAALEAEVVANVDRAQWVGLTSTPCHLGGVRWWLQCPRPRPDGTRCRRRVRLLYRPPWSIAWGCRRCWRLTYRCRQEHRRFGWEQFERPWRRLQRQVADRLSRSPRRRLRALLHSPLGPELREMMRMAGMGLDHRGRLR